MAAVRDGEEKALRDATLAKKTHFPSEQDWLWSGRSCFFLFYLQCFVLILNGDSDTLGILVRRRCTRARSGGELFPPKKEEVTGDRFLLVNVSFLNRESASLWNVETAWAAAGDSVIYIFPSLSSDIALTVDRCFRKAKKSVRDSLV